MPEQAVMRKENRLNVFKKQTDLFMSTGESIRLSVSIKEGEESNRNVVEVTGGLRGIAQTRAHSVAKVR